MVNKQAFLSALREASSEDRQGFVGIGSLSEKLMHKVVKLYIDPDTSHHEIECLGCIVDVKNERGIFEIQRASFSYMCHKLDRLLPEYRVTLVHPLTVKKRVKWYNRDTGEITGTGRLVKGKTLHDISFELYKIRRYLCEENFRLKILLVECDEYRALDGFGKDKKTRASRLESIPTDILGEIDFEKREDYLAFLPDNLKDGFTSRDFMRLSGSRSRYSVYSLRLLCELGILRRERVGREYVYYRK